MTPAIEVILKNLEANTINCDFDEDWPKVIRQARTELENAEEALRKACTVIDDFFGACPLDFEDGWDDCLDEDCDGASIECYMAYYLG